MTLKLNGSTDGSVSIDAPADTSPSGTDVTLTLPTSAGSSGQVLTTNGSGTLSWGPNVPDAIDVDASAPADSVNIDGSGRLLVGTDTARANFFNSTGTGLFQVEGTSGGTNRATMSLTNNSTGNDGAWFVINKSNGNADGSNNLVSSGNTLGSIGFQGSDGSEFVFGAIITAEVDGTPGANDMPGRLVFSTTADGASSPTERMRIASNGRLRVNLADFGSDVGTSNRGFEVNENGIILTSQPSTATQSHHLFYNPNGNVGSIQTNGSSTSFNTSSDYRLKENVVTITDGIARLQQLSPARFNFIADPDKTVDGFLAHEVQDVVPEAISGEKDAVDDEGNPVYQCIDQSKLVPLLTAALQEAISKIEALETRVAQLEGGAS